MKNTPHGPEMVEAAKVLLGQIESLLVEHAKRNPPGHVYHVPMSFQEEHTLYERVWQLEKLVVEFRKAVTEALSARKDN